MSAPTILVGHESGGYHTAADTAARLTKGKTYKDLSTVMVMPTRGLVQIKAVESWLGMIRPVNQKFTRVFVQGMEVGDAYNAAVELILDHPELSSWPYMLTVEEDNLPPPAGLLKLYESIDDYAVVGGLYFSKGEGGMPMLYGRPEGTDFIPQIPVPDTVQECNGLGMGFNLWNMSIFRDRKIPRPWFRTVQEWNPNDGGRTYTQDLYFFENARKAGYRVACDTRVKVGHIDSDGFVW